MSGGAGYHTLKVTGDGVLEPPKYPGDAGFDLVCAEAFVLEPREFRDADCGIAIAVPPATWGLITGRSSTFRKYRLHVVQGVIDEGYRGPIKVGLYNVGDRVVQVLEGMRLAQLILMPLIRAPVVKKGRLPASERGEAGFGSTGSLAGSSKRHDGVI